MSGSRPPPASAPRKDPRAGTSRSHSDRVTSTLMVIASIWAVGLLIAGVAAPSYNSVSASSNTRGTSTTQSMSATLVEVNGLRVLVALALPLLAVGVVALALRWRRRSERPGAGVVAWIVAALVVAVSLVGVLTIGPLVAPVAVLLVVACSRARTVASG